MPIDLEEIVNEPIWKLITDTENDPLYNQMNLSDNVLDVLLEFRLDTEQRQTLEKINGQQHHLQNQQNNINNCNTTGQIFSPKNADYYPDVKYQYSNNPSNIYRNEMNIKQNNNGQQIQTLGIQSTPQNPMMPGPSPKYPIAPSPGSSNSNAHGVSNVMINRQVQNQQQYMAQQVQSPMSSAMSPGMYGNRNMGPPMMHNNNIRGPDNMSTGLPGTFKQRISGGGGQLFSPPNMNDQHRLSADSPASQASADSNPGKRKRSEDDEGAKESTAVKRPKNNVLGDCYASVVDFIKRNVMLHNYPLLQYILDECQSKEKMSKRVVDFKDDEPRTLIILKPRVFCEKWKNLNNFDKAHTPTYSKLEKQLENLEYQCKIGIYPAIKKMRSREFQLLPTLINETPFLRSNHSTIAVINNKIVEITAQMPGQGQQRFPQQPIAVQQRPPSNGIPQQFQQQQQQFNNYQSQQQQQIPQQQIPQQYQHNSVQQQQQPPIQGINNSQPFSPTNRIISSNPSSATYIQHHRIPDQIASK